MSNEGSTENKVIHEVDGIEEYDNKLPNWWLYILYGSVVFGFCYWFVYQTAGFANLPAAEYKDEMEKAAAAQAEKAKTMVVTPEVLATLAKDKGTLEQGKQVFVQTCAACHRADGGGLVGPNLTDEFWIHGGAPDKVWKSVSQGVPDKGMPAWASQLGPDRVRAVTAYVISLRDTNVPSGKPAQGDRDALTVR